MSNAQSTAPSFKLQGSSHYFIDTKTRALVDAALAGDAQAAQAQVRDGADPNLAGPPDRANRISPLHYAVAAGKAPAIRVLGAVGADPETLAPGFGSPLGFSILLDKPEMLAALLSLRPPSTLKERTLASVMATALDGQRLRCLEVLLDAGVSVDQASSAGNTPFMEALLGQHWSTAALLLRRGAAVEREPTVAGMTPANTLQFMLGEMRPGTPGHQSLLTMQQVFTAKGIRFPVPTPAEVRAARKR